jgi:hypothetical protein
MRIITTPRITSGPTKRELDAVGAPPTEGGFIVVEEASSTLGVATVVM